MAQIELLFFILAGAAALGFLFAWTLQHRKQGSYLHQNKELASTLKECQAVQNRLNAENETQKLSLANLQNLLHNIESQTFALEQEINSLREKNSRLAVENKSLAGREDKVREIEVIREVPVLVFRDNLQAENRKVKAAKLVRAFKKGFTADKKKAVPPTS